MRTLLGASALICAWAQAAVAESSHPSPPMVEGGEGCGAAQITARSFVRHAPVGGDGSGVSIWIDAAPGVGWEAVVEGPSGERTVRDHTCQVVARAAGVIAALMVREEIAQAFPDPDPETDPDPDPETETETEAEVGREAGADGWTGFRLGAGVGEGIGVGGDVAVVRGVTRRLSLELGGRYAHAGVEGSLVQSWNRQLAAARAGACLRVAGAIASCAGVEGGVMTLGRVSQDQGRLRGRGAWVAPTAGAAVTMWHGGGASAYAGASVGYAVVRPAFLTLDDEPIHTPSRWSAQLSLGLTYRLW